MSDGCHGDECVLSSLQASEEIARESEVKDGLLAWFVCACAVAANSISFGTIFTYGIFFPFLLEEFQEAKSKTAAVASLATGINTLASPIASKLCLSLGSRMTLVIAGLVGAAGLLSSSFAPNLFLLFVGYGLALGFAVSLTYNGVFQIIPLYFDKHRFLAMGAIATGPGLGPLIMSPIIQAIIAQISWRKTMMFLAGTSVGISILGGAITRRKNNINVETRTKTLGCRRRLLNLVNMMDFSYFKDPMFMVVGISFAIAILGSYTPYFHLAQYASELKIKGDQSSWMYFAIGSGSMVFRIITGKLLDTDLVSPLRLIQISLTLIGAMGNFLVTLSDSFLVLMTYSFFYGVCDGVFVASFLSIIIKDFPGMGLGWSLFFQGFSFFIAPTLAGGIQLTSVCLMQTTKWIKKIANERTPVSKDNEDEERDIIVERETVC